MQALGTDCKFGFLSAMNILHLTADYPDPLQPAKTKAVRNLLELAADHDHHVYSLNRVPAEYGTNAVSFDDAVGEGLRAVAYGAAGRGWRQMHYLARLEAWLEGDIARRGLSFDAVHAHKLTIEGLVARNIAGRRGVPLAVSVQGNTDLKLIGVRPDLRGRFRAVWQGADIVFPFAPWAASAVAARLGPRTGPTPPLPCPGPGDAVIAPQTAGPLVRTAFHFRDAANKNALRLIEAVGKARARVPDLRLEIIGGGAPEAFASLARAAAALPEGAVQFAGAVPHGEMQQRFNAAAAFAMASHRESFGMVYSEALLAGCPCLISRGRGIDGYFEDGGVVLAVDPSSTEEMTEALVRLTAEEEAFKARLAALMDSGGLDLLRREAIGAAYQGGLAAISGQRAGG